MIVVLGVAVYVRSMSRAIVRGPGGKPVQLPCSVRRAVRRREAVPEAYRARIPAWVEQMRGVWWLAAGQAIWVCDMLVELDADNESWVGAPFTNAAVLAVYPLVLAVPLAVFRRWITLTGRHYTPADPVRGAP